MSQPDHPAEKRRRGRPSDLTPEVIAETARLLPVVLYKETVADFLGVTRMTFRNWIKRGREEAKRLVKPGTKPLTKEALYLEFFYTVKRVWRRGSATTRG